MRCPKCHYLSFEPEPRCKNCGYDLAVSDSDLALKTAKEFEEPLDDLELKPPPRRRPRPPAPTPTLELVHNASAPGGTGGKAEDSSWEEDWEERVIHLDRIEPTSDDALGEFGEENGERPVVSGSTATALDAVEAEPGISASPPPPVVVANPSDFESLARIAQDPPEPVVSPGAPVRAPHTTAELPLFVKPMSAPDASPSAAAEAYDLPVPTQASWLPAPPQSEPRAVPRAVAEIVQQVPDAEPPLRPVPVSQPPLSVRRSVPEPAKRELRRSTRPLGPLDRDLLEDLRRVESEERVQARAETRAQALSRGISEDALEGVAAAKLRAGAAAVDSLLLGGISVGVLWATLRVAESGLSDLGLTSVVPLAAFLLLVQAVYLLMFTAAGGQTLGKMLVGIRVVADDTAGRHVGLTLRQVAWRTGLAMVSVLAVGLGWVPALTGRGLAIHDRLAHTRVVRV